MIFPRVGAWDAIVEKMRDFKDLMTDDDQPPTTPEENRRAGIVFIIIVSTMMARIAAGWFSQ
ncbi:MAG: hypothetical protein A3H72_03960 [Candidatus Doudnabacteria bacterium RIFCSPLOWO2_02_FULL_48_8]|nr:MAG: hypothetical protein A3H72_03960 [Candidatus Doudnabacteria bacterium RIFCSPLOWO2_02_FULL_48_8]